MLPLAADAEEIDDAAMAEDCDIQELINYRIPISMTSGMFFDGRSVYQITDSFEITGMKLTLCSTKSRVHNALSIFCLRSYLMNSKSRVSTGDMTITMTGFPELSCIS